MCFRKHMANPIVPFIVILIHLGPVRSGDLELTNVTVPSYAVKDGSVQLLCTFTLESQPLLVLKWYKGEQEFFRYTPANGQNQNPILTFPVPGVNVDIEKSSLNVVTIKNVTLQTTGNYKCEVSQEKSFITKSKEGHMIVIAPPQNEPEITGVQSTVSIGDNLSGNCTSMRSRPASSLFFYINNEKAPDGDLIEYSPVNDTDGLESSVLGFNFTIAPHHFLKPGKQIELRCTATIGNFYWVKTMTLVEGNVNAQPSFSGHNRNLAGGAQGRSPTFLHMSIIQGALLCGLLFVSSVVTPVVGSRVH